MNDLERLFPEMRVHLKKPVPKSGSNKRGIVMALALAATAILGTSAGFLFSQSYNFEEQEARDAYESLLIKLIEKQQRQIALHAQLNKILGAVVDKV